MNASPLQFEIRPQSGVAIYRQIMDQVEAMIAGGRLRPGDLLPSVRQMAATLDINMMTVSKAYARLESAGWLERVRGKGMRITNRQATGSTSQRQAALTSEAQALVTRGLQLKLTDAQILAAVKTALKESRT